MTGSLSRRQFALTLAVPALRAETQQEKGKRVVLEALEALGGLKFQGMRNRVESGRAYSFYRERLTGLAVARVYTKYLDPARTAPLIPAQVQRQTFGKKEDEIILYNDKAVGYILTYRGAKPMPAERNRRYRESAIRNILYIISSRMNEQGLDFMSKGQDVIDNNPVELVDIYDSLNRSTLVAFHRSSKLPLQQTYSYQDQVTKNRADEVIFFSKYRDVGGGVQWPFHVERTRNGEKAAEIFAEHVEINQDLPNTLFEIPPGMTILPADAE
jgi:hypothetical protein